MAWKVECIGDPPAPKASPSKEQVQLVVDAIEGWPNAELTAWMDEDVAGDMLLSHEEDGLTMTATFGPDGQIKGDWF